MVDFFEADEAAAAERAAAAAAAFVAPSCRPLPPPPPPPQVELRGSAAENCDSSWKMSELIMSCTTAADGAAADVGPGTPAARENCRARAVCPPCHHSSGIDSRSP